MPPLLRALLLTLVLLVEGFASAVLSMPAAMAADDHGAPMAMPCHHDASPSAPARMPCCPDQDDQGGARCHLNCFGGANLLVPVFSAIAARPESLPPRVAVAPATVPALPDNPFRPPASLEV